MYKYWNHHAYSSQNVVLDAGPLAWLSLFLLVADKIHSKMGEGTFGQVLECWDRERKEMVAIKIVRGIKKYRDAAMVEIEVLQQLAKHDKGGNRWVFKAENLSYSLVQCETFNPGIV